MTTHPTLWMTTLFLAALLLAGCSAPPAGPTALPDSAPAEVPPLDPPVRIKLAEDGAASGAAFYLADAKGYFRQLGIEIEWATFQSGAEVLPALAADHVQVAGGVVSLSLFNAFKRGIEVKIMGDKGHNRLGKSYFDFVIRADLADEIQEIRDLRGRKVVMFSLESANEMMADKFIGAGGLTQKDVEFLGGFGATEMLLALANKSAHAAMLIEPQISLGVKEKILIRWKDLAEVIGPTENAVVLGSPAFLQNTELAGRFMLAYIKAARDYNRIFDGEDQAEIAEILSRYTELKDLDTWSRVQLPGLNPDGFAMVPQLEEDLVWYRKMGYFQGELEISDVVDHGPVEFALRYLGEYDPAAR